jgi:hypothetical protein
MLSALKHYAKGAAIVAHKLVLAQQENAKLQAANKAATQHKSHKRKRICTKRSLTVKEGQQLTALQEFGARSNSKKAKKQVRAEGGKPSQQRCRQCGEGRHNTQTCKNKVEAVSK